MSSSYFPRLEERRDQQAGTLSGGEQQMLALGRAMMARPKLLLLDEPSLGLAPIVVNEIFDALEKHEEARTGMSVLVVEQNANLALAHATRAYVLEVGTRRRRRHERRAARERIRPQVVPGLLMLVAAFTWTEFAQQLAAGIREGAIYAGLALAIVIIYRSTRVINFAQGEMATFTTFIAWSLMNHGLSFWAAFPIVLAIAFTGGVAIERIVIRPVENASVLTIVIVTLGLALLLNGLMSVIWGGANRQFHGPFSTRTIDVGGVPISVQDIGIVVVSIVLVALLALFFRFTKLGLALRAAAVNPDSSRLVGVRVGWMLALGWGIAAVLGAVAGMMIAPGRLPRPEHDADDPAVRVRRGRARRTRQPDRRRRRRDPARRHDHVARPLRRLHRLDAEAAGGACC